MLGVQHVESGYPEPIHDLTTYGCKGKLVCDWESSDHQTTIRERVGIIYCLVAVHVPVPQHAVCAIIVVSRKGIDVVLAIGARTTAKTHVINQDLDG